MTETTTELTTEPTTETRSGSLEVDDVLGLLARLDTTPVDEHVEIFEQAHRGLRRVLDAG